MKRDNDPKEVTEGCAGGLVVRKGFREEVILVWSLSLEDLVVGGEGNGGAEQESTGTRVNGDILGSSVPDEGQEHGHWSQNVCGFLGEGEGGDFP